MRVARTQPPVGYRVPFADLVRALSGTAGPAKAVERLERDVADWLGVRQAFALSSGKAALTLILRALASSSSRRKVVLPAYTCYSVPSAIVQAGLDPVPCDIAADSFDYDTGRLDALLQPDVLCVLSVHLFGIPSDTRGLLDRCRPAGITVVEDAAQALGGEACGVPLGTAGEVGFYSLGRGKNVTAGGGGLIVTQSAAIAAALSQQMRRAPAAGLAADARTFAAMAMMAAFIEPSRYWFPAGLPFLKLGETVFHEHVSVVRLSGYQAALMRGWRARLAALNETRRAHGAYYQAHIPGARGGTSLPYLRFPVLFDDPGVRQRVLADERARAVGISRMYPGTIGTIPQLQGRLSERVFPRAERVAATLVTLPTHPLLTAADRDEVRAVIGAAGRVVG